DRRAGRIALARVEALGAGARPGREALQIAAAVTAAAARHVVARVGDGASRDAAVAVARDVVARVGGAARDVAARARRAWDVAARVRAAARDHALEVVGTREA